MTNCPSEAVLRSIGTDAVDEATFAGLEEHIERCPDCQEVLEALARAVLQPVPSEPADDMLPTPPGLVIERELGRGGASVVYLAWDPTLQRHVALKLLPRNSLLDRRAREHWLAEARALARVSHDHVVSIHRVDESEEWLWLVIEYVSGGTLKQRLTVPLAPRDAARLMETIARTVGYFHARGVWHLDLKPSNILLDGEPGASWETVSPKISDFGIARLEGEPGTTKTGASGPKGTPSYMAPEQVACIPGTIGPAADIHALGALFYHLLTGRPPFQGASDQHTLELVRNHDPVPPRRLNGRIPRDLETICLTCLEKAPNRRYRSAEALAGDLRLWLDGRPIKARRVSPLGHAWRWCRRHPAVAGLLIALAITLTTGTVSVFVLLKKVEAERARLAVARGNAEAYEKFSASAADQLQSILRTTIRFQRNSTPDQMTSALMTVRNSATDLRSRGIAVPTTLGILEQEIGWALVQANRNNEAWDMLKVAIADLKQGLARNPQDTEVRFYLREALLSCAGLAQFAGQYENALDYCEQAAATCIALKPDLSEFDGLALIYRALQGLADRLRQNGRAESQERAQRVSQQILRRLLDSKDEHLTNAALLEIETLRRLLEHVDLKKTSLHDGIRINYIPKAFVPFWLATSVRPIFPFRSSSPATISDQEGEAGAAAIFSAIRDRCLKLGLADSVVEDTIGFVFNDAVIQAAEQRNLGRLDDARASAARLMALARRIVKEYPNSARSYRLLSEAHNQIRKNAIKSNDDNLIYGSLVRAIEAAQRAISLDPNNIETRRHLDALTAQLAAIEAERKAAISSVPK